MKDLKTFYDSDSDTLVSLSLNQQAIDSPFLISVSDKSGIIKKYRPDDAEHAMDLYKKEVNLLKN